MKKNREVVELTKASSRGQIVIPTKIRKDLDITEGSVFSVRARNDIILLKKLDAKISKEDLKTIKLIGEAWNDVDSGRFKKATPEKFFKELAKWKR